MISPSEPNTQKRRVMSSRSESTTTTIESEERLDRSSERTASEELVDEDHGIPLLEYGKKLRKKQAKFSVIKAWMVSILLVSVTSFVVAFFAMIQTQLMQLDNAASMKASISVDDEILLQRDNLISRIGVGSCSSYNFQPQPIFKHVWESRPDTWIWAGDFVYMDTPLSDCEANPLAIDCKCNATWQHPPNRSCKGGNMDHATRRVMIQLEHNDYSQFVTNMCTSNVSRPMTSEFIKPLHQCERPILGIYDDHDFGINDGNRRLSRKDEFKNLYLDAIGAPMSSERRHRSRGAYWRHRLNPTHANRAIDVILLDERYERDPLPCAKRRDWCEWVLTNPSHPKYAFCYDLYEEDLSDAAPLWPGRKAACCPLDDLVYNGWCKSDEAASSPLYREACDPTSPLYGHRSLWIDYESGTPFEEWKAPAYATQSHSPFCEMLGRKQRKWLDDALVASDSGESARLRVIVSGSVVLAHPEGGAKCSDNTTKTCACSGDDWDCYTPAQLNLLHTISRHSCAVLLVGDYHYSDLKVVLPGASGRAYAPYLKTEKLTYPIYQMMASGMTNSTAHNLSCDSWRVDTTGLRVRKGSYVDESGNSVKPGECSFVTDSNFGMIDIDWNIEEKVEVELEGEESQLDDALVTLAIYDREGQRRLTSSFKLSECMVKK